jgi:hypothetical protein
VMELMRRKRGLEIAKKPIDDEKWLFTARIPWAEVVTDLHDQLKNVTAGYGSLDTHPADPPWSEANHLCKVDLMLNGEVVAPLAFVCHRDVSHNEAKGVCKKVRFYDLRIECWDVTLVANESSPVVCTAQRSLAASTVCDGHTGQSRWQNHCLGAHPSLPQGRLDEIGQNRGRWRSDPQDETPGEAKEGQGADAADGTGVPQSSRL